MGRALATVIDPGVPLVAVGHSLGRGVAGNAWRLALAPAAFAVGAPALGRLLAATRGAVVPAASAGDG